MNRLTPLPWARNGGGQQWTEVRHRSPGRWFRSNRLSSLRFRRYALVVDVGRPSQSRATAGGRNHERRTKTQHITGSAETARKGMPTRGNGPFGNMNAATNASGCTPMTDSCKGRRRLPAPSTHELPQVSDVRVSRLNGSAHTTD